MDITTIITYIFLFFGLNFEVFLLITYFENKKEIENEATYFSMAPQTYPSVAIIVPCWNEEKTVSKTIYSLLDLDYPKDKLQIHIVNDGSTDNTWEVVQEFNYHPQIELHNKENGGKFTALNYGLSKIDTDLVGCLDADSYVSPDALKQIVMYFQNPDIKAVAPSIKLWNPNSPLELMQKIEYGFGIFTRKMFHFMRAIYITPGPFSIFRKEVFDKLGGYKHAHNTEDIELALRMQKNGYQIAHAHNAFVYTVPPKTIKTLLKQRVRWSYGFIKNAQDYKDMFFKPQYGNVGLLVLPMAAISILSILFMSSISIMTIIKSLYNEYIKFSAVGFRFSLHFFNFDWFYVNTQVMALLGVVTTLGTLTMIAVSKHLSEGKISLGMDLIYFMTLYMFIAPLWIGKAAYNALFKVKTTWR